MNNRDIPLCVDLDGSLLKTDLLLEMLAEFIKSNPLGLFQVILWGLRGRAFLKRKLFEETDLDLELLPCHLPLREFLDKEKHSGRRLVLATAADEGIAKAVADQMELFDEVIASDGEINLKAHRKAARLKERFLETGFAYLGNSRADMPVWDAADQVLVVNPSPALTHHLRNRDPLVFDDRRESFLRVWLRAARVFQWLKNFLLFVPLVLAHDFSAAICLRALVAFLAFGFVSSAIYFINDFFDLKADRHHPRKSKRPLAAGTLNPWQALLSIVFLLLGTLGMTLFLPVYFGAYLVLYFVLTLAYSIFLKQIAILDVFLLAGFYSIRILAGSAATEVSSSPWLIAFSTFMFLGLAMLKRYAELRELTRADDAVGQIKGRGYRSEDLNLLAIFGAGSGYLSVLVLSLYINSEQVRELYTHPNLLWLICPLLLYWLSRSWLLGWRGEIQDDPVIFVTHDRATCIIGVFSILILFLAC